MEYKKTVYDKDGKPIVIEELLTFKIEELNKTFIAFTINDDDSEPTATINLLQIVDENTNHPKIYSIDKKDEKFVVEVFNKIKSEK